MLFHREVFWPANQLTRWQGKQINFSFSRHALLACLNDRYGGIIPPKSIVFDANKAFELEINGGRVEKIVVRLGYNATHDISISFIPDGDGAGLVKTVWLNDKGDGHGTLNRKLYAEKIA